MPSVEYLFNPGCNTTMAYAKTCCFLANTNKNTNFGSYYAKSVCLPIHVPEILRKLPSAPSIWQLVVTGNRRRERLYVNKPLPIPL